MINHKDFGRLRLADFLPAKKISKLRDWEYEGRIWVGEACVFSEWLRLEQEPEVLRSLSIDLASFPAATARKVCAKLGLPLQRGMSSSAIEAAIGRFRSSESFVADRDSRQLTTKKPNQYKISCTVLKSGGLDHFSVIAPLPRAKRRARLQPHAEVALAFTTALVDADFERAHQLLAPALRARLSAKALRKELRVMTSGYSDSKPQRAELDTEFSRQTWPGKEKADVGQSYVSIEGDDFIEAVSVIVATIDGELLIRAVEWGRP